MHNVLTREKYSMFVTLFEDLEMNVNIFFNHLVFAMFILGLSREISNAHELHYLFCISTHLLKIFMIYDYVFSVNIYLLQAFMCKAQFVSKC